MQKNKKQNILSESRIKSHKRYDFTSRLRESYPLLRKSEKKVADFFLKNSQNRLDMPITDFARLIDVSVATVSRFCKAVGFCGFQDLKLSMAMSLNSLEGFKNIPSDIHETDSLLDISRKLSATLSSAISETQSTLDIFDFEKVIRAIIDAKEIMVYAIGGSSIIAYAAHHLLVKAGLRCGVYTDGYMQTVTAALLSEEGVAIGISNTGVSKHVVDALEIASAKGAKTIGITSNRDSALAKASDISLVTPAGRRDVPLYGGAIEARVCQLYILDVLYLGVLFGLGDRSRVNLQETTDALRKYYNPFNY